MPNLIFKKRNKSDKDNAMAVQDLKHNDELGNLVVKTTIKKRKSRISSFFSRAKKEVEEVRVETPGKVITDTVNGVEVVIEAESSNKLEDYRKSLSFPATLISDREAKLFMKMSVSPSLAKSIFKKRFIFSIGSLVALVAMMFIVPEMKMLFMGGAIVLPAFLWFAGTRSTDTNYRVFKFKRQLNFTKFCRLLIPYLSEMKNGVNLYKILDSITARMDDPADKKLVQTLMIEMTDRPGDEQPFLDFAKSFSGTDRADLFMGEVFDMNQGAFDDDVINDLGRSASDDLMKQINQIKDVKLSRFKNLTTWMTMAVAIPLFGYFGSLIVSIAGNIGKSM